MSEPGALERAEAARAEAEQAARCFAFLAEAGETLASSLDYEQTLRDVALLAVPVLGDLCIVDIIEPGGLRRVATAHRVPEKVALLEELRREYSPTPDSRQPAGRVLHTGKPHLLPEVTPEVVAAHTNDPRHAELILRIGIRSHIAVPLVARGVTLGVIGVAVTESHRRYNEEDLALAIEVARRAASAVDNARLYQAAQDELAERRRVEEALRMSESRFRAVTEQSPLSTQVFRADGTTESVNPAWEKLWGAELAQVTDYNVRHDPQLVEQGIAPYIERAFAGEAVEIPAIRYDPERTLGIPPAEGARWVRAVAYPIEDEAGEVREVVLIHEDVSARRRAEEQLRESETRLRLALEAARMNVWEWDLSTDQVVCSANAQELWGTDVGQASDFLLVVHPDDHQMLRAVTASSLEGKAPYFAEYRIVDREGAIRWVQSRGRVERDARGKPERIIGATLDVTERKNAAEATKLLADAGASLGASLDARATLQNLAEMVVPRLADWCMVDLIDERGELERVSVAHTDPGRAGIVKELFERYPPRRSSPHGGWHVLQTGTAEWAATLSDDILVAVAHDDEHLRRLRSLGLRSFICVPLVARGEPIGVLTLVHAESKRRYREEEVELAHDLARRAASAVENARLYERLKDADRRKDAFLATLAHELRNPLAPMRSGLDVLRISPPGVSTEKVFAVMERQLSQMTHLIDDLLDVSRVTRGKIELQRAALDLESVVRSAIEDCRPTLDAAGVSWSIELPEAPVVFSGDRTRLAQVLCNLLNNAAKYTPAGGQVQLQAALENGEVVIAVRDSGVGIPAEMLPRVFEMFVQVPHDKGGADPSGLGIGLTLVRELVELHGGRVWAESSGPGKGTTIVMRLPAFDEATQPARVRAEATPPTGPRRRVLVVDDNTDAVELLAMQLEIRGHEVRTAHDGPQALAVAEDFAFDIAFLDIGLPGMDGYELARRLRSLPGAAEAILVALTGWGQPAHRRRSEAAGFDHHLTKPVGAQQVHRLVEGAAEKEAGQQPL